LAPSAPPIVIPEPERSVGIRDRASVMLLCQEVQVRPM